LQYDNNNSRKSFKVEAGDPYCRGRLSMVDLLVLTSLDQLIFVLKILFTLVSKQATLMRRSAVLSLPLQLVFPGSGIWIILEEELIPIKRY
jgi:hypothetical protein